MAKKNKGGGATVRDSSIPLAPTPEPMYSSKPAQIIQAIRSGRAENLKAQGEKAIMKAKAKAIKMEADAKYGK